eukprot:TRINITY_DN4792_c0_g1_i1.p3 TRINITY_DN4792_c0_g1~~TRINITY_DN4792_c0_g1_i1.p3  ORF type:complete len:110 (+),score=32.37 TRINITY_DN4792_c0_g1_i1:585-914(+)
MLAHSSFCCSSPLNLRYTPSSMALSSAAETSPRIPFPSKKKSRSASSQLLSEYSEYMYTPGIPIPSSTPTLATATSNPIPVSYTHLRAHETPEHLVCRLLLEKKKKKKI